MALPNPRDKFWVTDPPVTFDDEDDTGVILMCVFTTRGKLLEFYQGMEGLPEVKRGDAMIRRYQKLQRDCIMLGWHGLAIAPELETSSARIIRFYGREGVDPVAEVRLEAEADITAEDLIDPTATIRDTPKKSKIITDLASLRS